MLQTAKHVDRVIVCDDGSSDMTAEIAERLGALVLRHDTNQGKGKAISTLFSEALKMNAAIVVTIDADLQHDPEDIPRLTAPILSSEADMVIGSRFVEGGGSDAPGYRKAGMSIINRLASPDGVIKDTQSGFRAFSRRALSLLSGHESTGFSVEEEQLRRASNIGLRIREVPVFIRYKGLGKTSRKQPVLHGAGLVATALRLVVEERPLLLLGVPGAALVFISLSLVGYLVLLFNSNRYFSIPIALISMGALILGMTLVLFGVILYALSSTFRKMKA